MMKNDLIKLAASVGEKLAEKGWCIATAESCTGGGVAAAITSVPGSSAWFGYGVVTYSNQAKHQLLGVDTQLVENHGAVSEQVVKAMVQGILKLSDADIGVAVSGIAGPGGGSQEKPVGGVWFAWITRSGKLNTDYRQFEGDRQSIQHHAVISALEGVVKTLEKEYQKNTV